MLLKDQVQVLPLIVLSCVALNGTLKITLKCEILTVFSLNGTQTLTSVMLVQHQLGAGCLCGPIINPYMMGVYLYN